ncbi:hypothetical protein LTR10_017305 [Elasticomyces elasticus]|uniref:RBR-type E3 ubiquitin transferase n=1 Tax=Exophiala sideris TaxID=1016849 RepID=A0ABR0JHU7_9EURO|nr:hypothetical protein LTR10_017305 [Elasticomyces elasticus]KAK5034134.1 hypothetical protein LTS07_003054 [Exophiala sideris]KAK5042430.1 hypothetical protein LTR13_001277 [Exophiala sideris]KAK5065512.1 hypothetical protein LTR69_003061 [Exophiala sideris]KAK5186029.1 hypothetical protein LTR44_002078 [Eurotiomycetes sp. CCFEE 6388]
MMNIMEITVQNAALAEEIVVLNAIYGDHTMTATFSDNHHTTIALKMPCLTYSFFLQVPHEYPCAIPRIVGVDSLIEYTKPRVRQNLFYLRACLSAVYQPDTVYLFDALDEFAPLLEMQSQQDKYSTTSRPQNERILQRLADRARITRAQMAEKYKAETPDLVDCSVCFEAFFKFQTANLECGHSYCRECLHEGVKGMFQSKSEFRCCGKGLPLNLIREYGDLDEDLLRHFSSWLRELHCPNPLYCPWEGCFAFIVRSFLGNDTKCPFCKRQVCVACGGKYHQGLCKSDKKLTAIIVKNRWKFCPMCASLVERSSGCNHMTCLCGADFCYRCGSPYMNSCGCKIFEELPQGDEEEEILVEPADLGG